MELVDIWVHFHAFPIPFYSTTLKLPSGKSTWIWKTNRFIPFLDHLFPREKIFHAVSNVGLLEGIRYPLYRLYVVYFKSSFQHHFFRLNPILSIESSISSLSRPSHHLPTIFQVKKMSPRDPTRTSHPVTVLSYIGHLQLKGQGEVLGSQRDSPAPQ